jgi:16S rRNA processing protein RimM
VSSKPPPERQIVMGRIVAPFGIKGWVKIEPYAAAPGNLLEQKEWWLASASGWQPCPVEGAQEHGSSVVAKLAGCDDRDAAARMKGREVALPRSVFPPAAPGEYYWADLIGLRVENVQGQAFGVVERLMETGANDVLVVAGERERLIPFIADVVKRVDLEGGGILVDWDADY